MLRFLVLASALLVACPSKQMPCTLHSDCPETERCVSGACMLICRVDRDCEGLGSCVQGQCVLVVNGGGSGGASGGATAGGAAGGMAGGRAGGGAAGGATAGGGTAGGATAGGGAAGGMTAGGGAAGGMTAGGGAAGGATAGGGAAGGGTGQLMFGEVCSAASQCASMLCVGGLGGQGVCTVQCVDESVCPPAWGCLSVGAVKVCVPSDSGRACPGGNPSQCFAGTCVGIGTAAVCSTPCDSTRACPGTGMFTCSLVQGISGRWCVPAGATCSTGNTCSSRTCAVPQVAPSNGVCTSECRNALDCPMNWACDGLAGTCVPIGNACTVNAQDMNNCASQTCAQPDDGGTGFCTGFCMDSQLQPQPARCPSGWTCTAEMAAGVGTVYVCE